MSDAALLDWAHLQEAGVQELGLKEKIDHSEENLDTDKVIG